MKWDDNERNTGDIIDRRGASGTGRGGLGGGAAKGGIGAVLLAILAAVIVPMLSGGGAEIDLSSLGLDDLAGLDAGGELPASGDATEASLAPGEDPNPELTAFANVVVTDANNVWAEQFGGAGLDYERTKMVLFSDRVRSGCGAASAAMGPFYCPADKLVYIDLTFFEELASRFGAPGDFAQAYVIAHEVAHHVQNELGIMDQVRAVERDDPSAAQGAQGTSVRTELQADCFAGVWAHSRYTRGQSDPTKRLDDGDIEEALAAASGVGDDSIQEQATGQVHPETFTHGTSAQRQRWFTVGYDSGDPNRCDTFSVNSLG